MPIQPPTRILVIDEVPLIAVGLREVFRSINPSIQVEYSASLFTALSAKAYSNSTFDLVIIGSFQDGLWTALQQAASELKERFGQPLVMIYSNAYDPLIVEKMSETGIHAYVHKHESIDEIINAYRHLSAGEPYISGIFHTLYFDYRYRAGN